MLTVTDPPTHVDRLRMHHRGWTLNKIDPSLCRTLAHGWLLPYLVEMDHLTYGRWDYWEECVLTGELPERAIPPVDFLTAGDPAVRRMLSACLDAIPNHGSGGWQGWGGWTYMRYFFEWLLFGFGHPGQPQLPDEPFGCEGASMRLYQTCNVAAWLLWPHDYLGDILAENAYGQRQGFYPTPHGIVEMMVKMVMGSDDEDRRTKTVCDPCLGTGRMLLYASNYSLRLYGMDIDGALIQAALVNGYLYAPWMVRPLPFLDGEQYQSEQSAAICDSIAATAPPHLQGTLEGTEADPEEQPRLEPIKKRRRVVAVATAPPVGQESLF